MAHLRSCEVRQLLHNKFVVVMGDAVQRAVYKDLVLLLQRDALLSAGQLRATGELSFEGDALLEGGGGGRGPGCREVRQFRAPHHLLRFYGLARAGASAAAVLRGLRAGPHAPDLLVLGPGPGAPARPPALRRRLRGLFAPLRRLPAACLRVWHTALPAGAPAAGPPGPDPDLREADACGAAEAARHGLDVLDLHFHLRRGRRPPDGRAHRRLSQLLLAHVADAWGVDLPRRGPREAEAEGHEGEGHEGPEAGRQHQHHQHHHHQHRQPHQHQQHQHHQHQYHHHQHRQHHQHQQHQHQQHHHQQHQHHNHQHHHQQQQQHHQRHHHQHHHQQHQHHHYQHHHHQQHQHHQHHHQQQQHHHHHQHHQHHHRHHQHHQPREHRADRQAAFARAPFPRPPRRPAPPAPPRPLPPAPRPWQPRLGRPELRVESTFQPRSSSRRGLEHRLGPVRRVSLQPPRRGSPPYPPRHPGRPCWQRRGPGPGLGGWAES